MALIDILRMLAAKDGISIDNADMKALAIARVNEAALDLWESQDFPESLDEKVFDVDVDSQLVALPWYVEHLRGWRFLESREPGDIAAKQNRYNKGIGDEIWLTKWREIKHSPLKEAITNESVLTLSLPIAESAEFSVSIIGATPNSEKIQETLTFAVGETEKTTTGNFKDPIYNIIKSSPTAFNLTIKDAQDTELAVIPNHLTECFYKIIQLQDTETPFSFSWDAAVEFLFKRRFTKLVNDYDCFLYGNKYDNALYWKYKELNTDNLESAAAFHGKCDETLAKIQSSASIGVRRNIGFTKNPYFNLPYATPDRSYRRQGY